ncbi:DUF1707 domain-containing protein [Streptomyces sviceus]|uniref:DUF1707 domain-containing protein n=1 Tax=Streptomyces sviceus TaxID=285530 RepID=UPI0036ECF28C
MAGRIHRRIGDQDRETATRQLSEHFANGYLTKSELDARLEAALAAETAPALREVLHDLPTKAGTPQPPAQIGPWSRVAARLKARRGRRTLVLTLAAWGAGGFLFGADWLLSWPGRLLLVCGVAVALLGGRPERPGGGGHRGGRGGGQGGGHGHHGQGGGAHHGRGPGLRFGGQGRGGDTPPRPPSA